MDRKKVLFAVMLLFLSVIETLSPGSVFATSLEDAGQALKHAKTYYWLGIYEEGNMDSFYKGLGYIDSAKALLQDAEDTEDKDELKKELRTLKKNIEHQMDVHHDTLSAKEYHQ